jgi:hypothetical protein
MSLSEVVCRFVLGGFLLDVHVSEKLFVGVVSPRLEFRRMAEAAIGSVGSALIPDAEVCNGDLLEAAVQRAGRYLAGLGITAPAMIVVAAADLDELAGLLGESAGVLVLVVVDEDRPGSLAEAATGRIAEDLRRFREALPRTVRAPLNSRSVRYYIDGLRSRVTCIVSPCRREREPSMGRVDGGDRRRHRVRRIGEARDRPAS